MTDKTADELTFLRWFYENVDDALGPASDDIYLILQEEFEKETGQKVPGDYTLL